MFLETVAKHLVSKEGETLSNRCFVFPNRRSGLFFKRFLLKHSTGTQWAPAIVTINELMQELSVMEQSDPLDLLFSVYDVYKGCTDTPDSFDTFYPWGEMMLGDFDNLDKYMVDPVSIFRNIRELKEIDEQFGELDEEHVEFIRKFWKSFHQGGDTREKEMFLSTWKMLPDIYTMLKAQLGKSREGYEGMIYRTVAEMDITEIHARLKHQHYYIIGFNALTTSEKMLFSKLQKKGVVSFYWDYDEAYINDTSMEAGRFLRENLVNFPPPDDLGIFNMLQKERAITIIDLPSDVLQAKMVYQILEGSGHAIHEANDTAIIACDENLLMPVLFSLPETVEQVNITMGYPFSNTPLSSFIEAVLRLQKNVRKAKSGKTSFYHKDVLSVLNHQYFRLVNKEDTTPVTTAIRRENRVYIEADYFITGFSQIVFREIQTAVELCDYLGKLVQYVLTRLLNEEKNSHNELEKEYLMVILNRLNKLSAIIQGRDDLLPDTFIRIFRRMISNLRIPFEGEPLAGLQIMGILETRLLDFNHVIMLSVNEDIMPRSSSGHSFIPYSMRVAYGLPVREEMDAIYAYYFYRLIQRAGKVDLLFKSASEGVKSGEMSRYLYQMKYEYNAKFLRPVLPVTATGKRDIRIEKSPEILAVLGKYLVNHEKESFLSPSALNSYIECPLRFYFRKILNIGEQEELLEELDAIGFGNILHKTIHKLYDSLRQGKTFIESADLKGLLSGSNMEQVLLQEFRKEYFKSDSARNPEGRNLIIVAILKKYLIKIIETDALLAPLELLDLEQSYHTVKEINTAEGKLAVRVGGLIDRIDRLQNGVTRIIDYKTGNAETRFESIDSLFDTHNKRRSKEAFQAFIYGSLFLEKYPDHIVQPGLYVVRNLYEKEFTPQFVTKESGKSAQVNAYNEYNDQFQNNLTHLLEEIYNAEIPFTQTEITDRCSYCDFKEICQRN